MDIDRASSCRRDLCNRVETRCPLATNDARDGGRRDANGSREGCRRLVSGGEVLFELHGLMLFAIWQVMSSGHPKLFCQSALVNMLLANQSRRMAELQIRDYRQAAKLTLEDLAADAEISVSQLSRIETGHRVARIDELERIGKRLKVPVASLIGEEAPFQVPLVSWVSAGDLKKREGVHPAEIERYVPVANLPKGEWIALEVDGNSMDRIAPDGSVVIVNLADDTLINDRFYIFALESGETTFKRYRRTPRPMLQPFSTNLDHVSIPVADDEFYVVGRVRRVITDL